MLRCTFEGGRRKGTKTEKISSLNPKNEFYFERSLIHLPEEAQKKVKRKQLERYVYPIPAQLESVLSYFHDNPKPPSLQAWSQNLAR